MAAGVRIKLKRKTTDFAGSDLQAGEVGIQTTDKSIQFSTDGSDIIWLRKKTTTTSSATPTPTGDARENIYTVTAQGATGAFAAPSGTPADGNKILVRIKDNGTARTLSWNAIYRAISVTLPLTTVLGKTLYLGFMYNSADSKWDCIALAQEA